MISVFGSKPKDAIYLGDQPYAVRNDCSVGKWKVGDEDYRASQLEVSIIKASRYFGTLGKATNTEWLQLWFVPAPSCDCLPRNTVCLTYLKTRSLSNFSRKITELLENGEPALGIFTAGFESHSNEYGKYYSLNWNWRERKADEELQQLEQIAAFFKSAPVLIDLASTKSMVCLEGMPSQEIQLLLETTQTPALKQV